MRFNKLHKQVLSVLCKHPYTRNSDADLYYILLKDYYETDCTTHSYYAITHRKDLPQMESVGRVRRKVQENHPELQAVADVEAGRMVMEEKYIGYAKGTFA